ncbi:MAG: sigma-70 family RNA polymerase sigma factor [Planctomycetales bacterium]|nr:sigma-70 family RNA polymerase sigma factor [Planctomycetales bacterium]
MPDPNRLSQIDTLWSMVYCANREGDTRQGFAQAELLARYGTAIQRYLVAALRDETAAEDVYQEFAVRFLRGDFAQVHHAKGRFRGFLKVVLGRMVADHFRYKIRRPTKPLEPHAELSDVRDAVAREDELRGVWRDEMLTLAWQRLGEEEQRSGKPWLQVLKLRVEQPRSRSSELAARLADAIGEPVTATRLRVLLHRAREKFSDYLLAAVAETLREDCLDAVEQELAELELLRYCQASIDRRRKA